MDINIILFASIVIWLFSRNVLYILLFCIFSLYCIIIKTNEYFKNKIETGVIQNTTLKELLTQIYNK